MSETDPNTEMKIKMKIKLGEQGHSIITRTLSYVKFAYVLLGLMICIACYYWSVNFWGQSKGSRQKTFEQYGQSFWSCSVYTIIEQKKNNPFFFFKPIYVLSILKLC